jgi:hypothetical protein
LKGPADFRFEPDEAFVCEVRRLFRFGAAPDLTGDFAGCLSDLYDIGHGMLQRK